MSDFERSAGKNAERLSTGQEKAIRALLTRPTLDAAAKTAGVSVATLRRWRSQEDFALAYKQARAALLESATIVLRQAATKAVVTLVGLLDSSLDSVKLRSAQAILDFAFKATEIEDLAERLEALESAAAQETTTTKRRFV